MEKVYMKKAAAKIRKTLKTLYPEVKTQLDYRSWATRTIQRILRQLPRSGLVQSTAGPTGLQYDRSSAKIYRGLFHRLQLSEMLSRLGSSNLVNLRDRLRAGGAIHLPQLGRSGRRRSASSL